MRLLSGGVAGLSVAPRLLSVEGSIVSVASRLLSSGVASLSVAPRLLSVEVSIVSVAATSIRHLETSIRRCRWSFHRFKTSIRLQLI
ncbi:hypothetical protein [Lysinibacillus xylanilyticus]|uniref:hypothetical protein n=1 Tax=Lysinibacillus xylanilyticus TaxID=582475 RepID=UPI003CFD24F3